MMKIIIKQQKKLKYSLFTPTERDYWKNLHINIDTICDKWEDVYSKEISKHLKLFSEDELKEIFEHYKIKKDAKKSYLTHLFEKPKSAIDFLCITKFAYIDPKTLSILYNIPIKAGVVDKSKVVMSAFRSHQSKKLLEIFLLFQRKKFGKGNFHYNFEAGIQKKDFPKFEDAIDLLCRHLKRNDKHNKTYHYRASHQTDDEWIFLLLKETEDVIFPAIPENTRVLKGAYLLITIKLADKKLEINTKSNQEAYKIKDYLARKTNNPLLYEKKISTCDPVSFFKELKKEKDTKNELALTNVDFKRTNINSELRVLDTHHKNDIFTQLNTLKEKEIIKLTDFTEFRSLTFQYKGISFKINVFENQWGQFRFNLVDSGKPKVEAQSFKTKFEEKFKVPLDAFLKSGDASTDQKRLTRSLMDKTTVEANLPKEVEDILLDLIGSKIYNKPSKTSKRKCEKCRKFTWVKGDCPTCGNHLLIEGNYIDLKPNEKGIYNFIYQLINSTKQFTIKKTKAQIDSSSFQFIDLIDKMGTSVSLYISNANVSEKIIHHFQETGSPLIVVLVKLKDALATNITSYGFECIDVAGIYSNKDNLVEVARGFQVLIEKQKHLWQQKTSEKGYSSYLALLEKKTNYNDQNFEKDIYNLLHEMFLVGDRLGGKFAGVPAPDGIVSIQNYAVPLKRYCLAWDCKYSVIAKGYQLADPPYKHRRYINTLKKNDKVLLYGGLKTYAIISQNMDLKKYEAFYLQLTKGFKWKGNVLFVPEIFIRKLYKVYKDNEEAIQNSPGIFYTKIYKLFADVLKKDSVPYKQISEQRLLLMIEDLEKTFKAKKISFIFERKEFQ